MGMTQTVVRAQTDPSTKAALQALASGSRHLHLPCNLVLPESEGVCRLQAFQELRLLPAQRWVVAVRLEQPIAELAPADNNIDPQQGLLKLFVGPKAKRHQLRELAAAKRLANSGVATPPLITQGQWLGDKTTTGYFLLYAWVQGQTLGVTPAQEDFCRVVQAVAGLHNQGLQQTDMHLGNFLVAPDQVYAVDASAIEELPTGRQRTAAALDNLAVLFAQQQVAVAHEQLDQWVRTYQRAATAIEVPDATALAVQMRTLTQQQRGDRVRRYLHKSLRDSSEFHVQKARGSRFLCVRQDMGNEFAAFAQDPESTMALGHVLKAGNTATVVRSQIGGQTVVVKRYNIKHWRHRIAQSLRPTGRALRAWHNALRLHFLGIPTARPMALLETWQGPLRGTAYLVLADLGDNDLLHALQSTTAAERWVQPLAALMRTLAQAGLVHGDTKATNFIINNDNLHIIDLDAMRDVTGSGRGWARHPGFAKDRQRLLRNWQQQPEITALVNAALEREDGQDKAG